MSSELKHHYSMEEYLALERESEVRYEYWDGEIFAMSGGTLPHDQIMGNLFDFFRTQLRGMRRRAFTNNMQLKVPAASPYRYADGSVACGQVEVERFSGNDLLLNPSLIYEVLSPSTEAFDRGDKFVCYQSIFSLHEYLLVAQHCPQVTHYVKQTDDKWEYEVINDLAASLYLPTVECTLALSEVYREVEFT